MGVAGERSARLRRPVELAELGFEEIDPR
jgi:hypothetical protein